MLCRLSMCLTRIKSFRVIAAGLTFRACGSCLPWLCLGTTYMLPASLFMAVSHHHCPWGDPSVFTRSLFFLKTAVYSTSIIMMYKHALRVWKQRPPPAWDGAPIYWRAGPEHAAACFSEWLQHLHWLVFFDYYIDKPYHPSSPEVAAAIFGKPGTRPFKQSRFCTWRAWS